MKTLGERLKTEREAWPAPEGHRVFTQSALAKRSGVSQTTIADIERDRNQGSTMLTHIAAALNLNPLWLMEERGPKYADPNLARRMGFLPPVVEESPGPGYAVIVEHTSHLLPVINQTEIEMYRELIHNPNQATQSLPIPAEHAGTALFLFRMEDDSMARAGARSLPEHWYAVVDADRAPDLGELVVVRLEDGRAYCREYVADAGGRLLKPANPQYSSRPAPSDPGAYLGVVVGRYFSDIWT